MASVPQLSTLQKSAAERPQLEVAQQQMQTRVSSLESQFEAASAGAKQVRHLNSILALLAARTRAQQLS